MNDAPVFALNNAVAPGGQTGSAELDLAMWGSAPVPTSPMRVKAVSAGGSNFVIGLQNDGSVAAWGANNYGQLNVPAGLSGVSAVAAGYHWGMALKTDGTVSAWGNNDNGQTNIPAGLNNCLGVTSATSTS